MKAKFIIKDSADNIYYEGFSSNYANRKFHQIWKEKGGMLLVYKNHFGNDIPFYEKDSITLARIGLESIGHGGFEYHLIAVKAE